MTLLLKDFYYLNDYSDPEYRVTRIVKPSPLKSILIYFRALARLNQP